MSIKKKLKIIKITKSNKQTKLLLCKKSLKIYNKIKKKTWNKKYNI